MISTNDIRALELYELALSLVEAKGVVSGSTLLEYRAGNLTIHYLPTTGHLEVWYLQSSDDQSRAENVESDPLHTRRVGG